MLQDLQGPSCPRTKRSENPRIRKAPSRPTLSTQKSPPCTVGSTWIGSEQSGPSLATLFTRSNVRGREPGRCADRQGHDRGTLGFLNILKRRPINRDAVVRYLLHVTEFLNDSCGLQLF
jgi:hypothetical protein